jgi:hypothetical protein
LPLTAVGGRIDHLDLALNELYPLGFDHGVQRKRSSGFPLTPAAVAAVHEERLGHHSKTNEAASAAAVVAAY